MLDGDGFTDEATQRVVRWTNLSETTFVLPPTDPEADYRLDLHPRGELPFAGHPTLGSAHAWLEHGGITRGEKIVQQCAAGLVDVRPGDGILSFAAPPTRRSGDLTDDELSPLLAALGIHAEQLLAHHCLDNGPGWNVIRVATAEEVLALEPDPSSIPTAMTGVIGDYNDGSQYAFEIRTSHPPSAWPRIPSADP